MSIIIFTDGSSRGNPGPGGWGAVIASEDQVVELGGNDVKTTNNRMELTAVIRSLQFANSNFQFSKIKLHTDSEYIVKGITSWVMGWQKNNWRTAARKTVLNQDLWQELIKAVEGKEIEWIVVAGHSGVLANERCDEIATAFADGLKPILYSGPKELYQVSLAGHAGAR